MDSLEMLILITFILALTYYFGISNYGYWKSRGVPYIKPKHAFFGSSLDLILCRKSVIQEIDETYWAFPNARFFGSFELRKPKFTVRDPDLIETITARDFPYFTNRYLKFNTDVDPLTAHLIGLRDEQWKNLRSKLTPTFSSGKLKGMYDQIIECSDCFVTYLSGIGEKTPFEVRELTSRFATDVISSCSLGLNSDTINDSNNLILAMGKRIFRVSKSAPVRRLIRSEFDWFFNLIKWKTVPVDMEEQFTRLIRGALEWRDKNKISRPDFLHLLNELRIKDMELIKNGQLSPDSPHVFTEKLLFANAFMFLMAGFETTATSIALIFYELALNPLIQDKLYKEIKTIFSKHGCELTLSAVNEMTYLSQVISESLRKYPPISALSREVTRDYRVPGTDLVLSKGMEVFIPTHSIHHDPKYYPEPDLFDPERFSSENKHKIRKGTYHPYGIGPRFCIGIRFADLEMKVALCKVLLKFKLDKCDKTKAPLVFEKRSRFLVSEGGIWIALELR